MYRSYGWPNQQYSINPNIAPNLPRDVASAQWQKRMNVKAVLENMIPAGFADLAEIPIPIPCNECSVIIDEDNEVVHDQRPPTDIRTTSAGSETVIQTPTAAGLRKRSMRGTSDTIPLETGSASCRK
ncbi:glycoside hydrolase family 18 protein [Moelleriella libera RCEF 2490]|uniref:Glycoside hydrolase family 18 protein n=1 Tax=Moelleriella libera RCEF 2490 TaxID=1081109 RepID=A0A167Z4Y7_9HYPO|nr:glycoside hydrolase family 18 protein [Moelleriella libera RCEF 2490]